MGAYAIRPMHSLHLCDCSHFIHVPILPALRWPIKEAGWQHLAISFCLLGYLVPLLCRCSLVGRLWPFPYVHPHLPLVFTPAYVSYIVKLRATSLFKVDDSWKDVPYHSLCRPSPRWGCSAAAVHFQPAFTYHLAHLYTKFGLFPPLLATYKRVSV